MRLFPGADHFRGVYGGLIGSAVIGALAIGSSIALLGTSGWLISAASLQPPILHLSVAIVMVRFFGISRSVFRYAERWVSHNAAFRGLTGLRISLYRALEPIVPGGLLNYRRGDLISRAVNDVDRLADLPLRVFLPIAAGSIAGLTTVGVVCAINISAGLVLLVALVLGAFASSALALRKRQADVEHTAPLVGRMADDTLAICEGLTDIVMLGQQERALQILQDHDAELVRRETGDVAAQSLSTALLTLVQGLAVLASFAVGAQAVLSGTLDGRMLAVVTLIPLAAFETVAGIPAAVVLLADLRSSLSRVDDLLSEQPTVQDPEQPAAVDLTATPPFAAQDLAVSWPDGRGLTSVTMVGGDFVGVVGRSGSGKSTLAAALVRFLAPTSGTLTELGSFAQDLNSDEVRSHIGLFDSNQFIFATSVAANLRIANPDATEDQLWAALRLVGLAEWCSDLPDGLETVVGDRGAAMSGGERSRLLLARLLLGSHEIVVLDEPTEYLDQMHADLVLSASKQGRRVLLLTHRLLDLETAERVYLIEQGHTVASGRLAEIPALAADLAVARRIGGD